jgi:hypothetical protein
MKILGIIKHPIWDIVVGMGVGLFAVILWIGALSQAPASAPASVRNTWEVTRGDSQGMAVLFTVIAGYLLIMGVVRLRRLRKAAADDEGQGDI